MQQLSQSIQSKYLVILIEYAKYILLWGRSQRRTRIVERVFMSGPDIHLIVSNSSSEVMYSNRQRVAFESEPANELLLEIEILQHSCLCDGVLYLRILQECAILYSGLYVLQLGFYSYQLNSVKLFWTETEKHREAKHVCTGKDGLFWSSIITKFFSRSALQTVNCPG